jgi:PIN domain nuclease of toxin-antitoxin system
MLQRRAGASPAPTVQTCDQDFGRIELDLDDPELDRFLSNVHVWPLTLEVVRAVQRLDFDSDPADELIAATSLVYEAPLLTRDRRLLKSRVLPLARR